MSKIFSVKRSATGVDIALLIGRIGVGAMMLTHGLPKLDMLGQSPVPFVDFLGLGAQTSLLLAIFAEVVCSILVILGLATRLALIPLIITMLTALMVVHSADPFAVKELAVHFLVVFLMLLFTGPGKYSVDRFIAR